MQAELKFNEIINKQKEEQKLKDEEKAKQEEEHRKKLEEELEEILEVIVEEDEEDDDESISDSSDSIERQKLASEESENEFDSQGVKVKIPPYYIKCNTCKKKFNNLSASIIHTRHKCKEIYPCKSCPNIYITSLKLENHVKSTHENNICEICRKVFKSYMLLKKHIRYTHNKERHFTCDICNKGLIDITALRVHKESHKPKGEKRLYKVAKPKRTYGTGTVKLSTKVCEICGLTFKSNQLYYLHKRYNHNPDKVVKKFKCGQCDYSAFSSAQIKAHTRVHTGERPYKCPHCPSAFKLSNALKYHVNSIHLHLKNHQCKICGKKLADSMNLRAHVRRHTGERPFVCDICPEAFFEARPLRRHKAKFHPEEEKVE